MSEIIKKVRKRDGRIVDFDRERITKAIFAAAVEVGGRDRRTAKRLSDEVVKILEEKYAGTIPGVEEIQDVVEKVLIERGHARTAKAYILYRKQHEEMRKLKSTFLEVENIVDDYLGGRDWRVRENSNMGFSYSGLLFHVATSVVANYTLDKIYSMEISDAHTNGDMHIHDLGSGIVGYCAGWNLRQLLAEGFNGVPGKVASNPPAHLDTALLQMANFIGCYDDQTEVLTKDGWKKFEEASYNDEILTLNPETYELEYQHPTKFFKYDYNGEMISIKTRSLDLLVTPNHRFFVERITKQNGKHTFKKLFSRADGLKSMDRAPRTGKWKCRDVDYFVLPSIEKQWRAGAGHKQERTRHWPEMKIPIDDWLRFLGVYLAEGSVYAEKNRGKETNYFIRISQSNPQKKRKIKEFLQKLPFKYYEVPHDLVISNKQLWAYLSKLGKSHEKYILKEFKELPPERLSILLEWMLMGDGGYYSRSHGLTEYVTTSKHLADDVQELFLKVGRSATILMHERGTMISPTTGKPCPTKRLYKVREHKSKNSTLKSQKIGSPARDRVHYNGKIYCVEVPNHVVYVRRNGKPIFCGNSLQNEWAGAQAFNSIDVLLAPFVRRDLLNYRQVRQAMQTFVFNLNIASRWGGQTPFTNITLDLTVPEDLAGQHVTIGGTLGDKTYEEYTEEMEMINNALMEVMMAGDMSGRPFTFPVPTFSLTKDFEWDNGVSSALFEMTAKYGLPYFQNFINSDLRPSDVRAMCCRLQLDLRELRKNVTGGLFGSGDSTGCYDEKTEVLTKEGWKLFSDLTFDDEVVTLHPNTSMIEYQRPLRIFEHDYEGEMVRIKTKSLDLLVTPNHNMFVEKPSETTFGSRKKRGTVWKKMFCRADQLDEHTRIPRVGEWNCTNIDKFVVPEITYTKYGAQGRTPYQVEVKPKEIPIDSWLKFLGIYLAEGSVDGEGYAKTHGYRVCITQIDRGKREKIRGMLKELPFKFTETEHGFVICSKQLWLYLKRLGNKYEKYIPEEFKQLPPEQLSILLEWMVVGDGYKRTEKSGRQYWTTSKKLADDVHELFLKLGSNARIYIQRKKESLIRGRKVVPKTDCYHLSEDCRKYSYLRSPQHRALITRERYRGKVYCCEVPNHIVCVRRNGKAVFCGNSVGVVTINVPRLGHLSKNEDEFCERLEHVMELARISLETKREIVKRNMENGLLPFSKRYLGTVNNHFSTIGLVGMNEGCLNLLKCSIATDEGKKFAVKTLNFMRERIQRFQEETGNIYNLEATPAEGVSYRLAKIDKRKYPDVITAGEKAPYYTNSTTLPVNSGLDLIDALRHQEELQTLYTGGTVHHIFLGESLEDGKSCMNLVRKVAHNTRLPYFTVTPTYTICDDHGFIPGEYPKCPSCGKDTEVYSRVVGYYRPVKNFNVGKQEEFRQRIKYT